MIQELYRAKRFLKLDIAKAWHSTVELFDGSDAEDEFWIKVEGLDLRISILLSTATSALVNGTQGYKFKRSKGSRQGDPLSPTLNIGHPSFGAGSPSHEIG